MKNAFIITIFTVILACTQSNSFASDKAYPFGVDTCKAKTQKIYYSDGKIPDNVADYVDFTEVRFVGDVFRIPNTSQYQNIRSTVIQSIALELPLTLCSDTRTSPFTMVGIELHFK